MLDCPLTGSVYYQACFSPSLTLFPFPSFSFLPPSIPALLYGLSFEFKRCIYDSYNSPAHQLEYNDCNYLKLERIKVSTNN